MGLFDLPAPLFGIIDQALDAVLPAVIRLVLWGVLAGWLTMVVYRRLSKQDQIQLLKAEQKKQQKIISSFDGELEQLFPIIRHTLALGMRQLGLSLGPALLATIPILFLVIWVAGEYAYQQPVAGTAVTIEIEPPESNMATLVWDVSGVTNKITAGWVLTWPSIQQPVTLLENNLALLELPAKHTVSIIHKHHWWNWLMANPNGYLPAGSAIESINIALPEQQFLAFGPAWVRGWMCSFFLSFLLSSLGFKLALKID